MQKNLARSVSWDGASAIESTESFPDTSQELRSGMMTASGEYHTAEDEDQEAPTSARAKKLGSRTEDSPRVTLYCQSTEGPYPRTTESSNTLNNQSIDSLSS